MNTKEIVLLQTNKGIVAVENGQIFDLWKTNSLIMILDEIRNRYPNYSISLVGLIRFQFNQVIIISNSKNSRLFLTKPNELNNIRLTTLL